MADKDELYRSILDNIADGVYFCDGARRITYWNRGAERITGYSPGDVVGSSCADSILVHVDERGESLCRGHCPMAATLTDGQPREVQAFLHHKLGHRVPVSIKISPILGADGGIEGAVETFSDNSPLVAALERLDTLSVESETDALTGLANRRRMTARLQACLAEGKVSRNCAVFFVDIDHFKLINDTYGHEVGDRVLKMVAATLEQNLRASDLVARWGGEEFVGLLYRLFAKNLRPTAEKLRALVESSFLEVGGEQVRATVSIGATFIKPGDTVQSVIARADRLLYQSKTAGRNRVTLAA